MPSGKNNRVVVGLTGGIGSGKSTVLEMFRKKGAFVLDSDAIVHKTLKSNTRVLARIRRRFGNGVFGPSGDLNKKMVAARVFQSAEARRFLERLIHPVVRNEILRKLRRKKRGVAVVDVPLLFESGWRNRFDGIVVVDATRSKRIGRLVKKGFAREDIRRRMRAQWPLRKKVRLADFVVNNNENKSNTRKQIEMIWKSITAQKAEGA